MAITHHPDALGQRRLDPGLHELHPGGIHQQQLGFYGEALVVHLLDDGAHPLRQGVPPGSRVHSILLMPWACR